MRLIAIRAALLGLLVGVALTIATNQGVEPPTVDVRQVRTSDPVGLVDDDSDRDEHPTALILSHIRSPSRFLIQGHVIPRHNRGIKLWASVVCVSRGRFDEYQDTLTEGSRDPRGGFSITLDVRVSDADLCSVNAIAGPEVGVGARHRKVAFARVSLHCPTGCLVDEPPS